MKKLFTLLLISVLLLQVSSAQNVGIGTITPMALLDVNGDALVNGLKIGRGGGNDASNTVTGISCLGANTSGVRNSAFGVGAMSANTSGHNNAAYGGYSLLNNTSGNKNAAFGDDVMNANTSGSGNTSIGYASMYNSTTGSFNAALGQLSGLNNVTGSYNLCLGSLSDVGAGDLVNASAIGHRAYVGASNSMVLGSIQGVNGASSNTKVGIGTTTPAALLDVNADVLVNGLSIGRGLGNDVLSTVVGKSCLMANTSGIRNSAFGHWALRVNTSGERNVACGTYSLLNNTSGYRNAAFGDDAMNANTSGFGNASSGQASMYHSTSGFNNVSLGLWSAWSNVTGSYNLCLGTLSDVGAEDLVNASAIGSNAYVSASNSMVLGSIQGVNGASENTKVGIGTTAPTATLDVSGTFNASAWKTSSVSANGYAEMGGVLVQWGSVNYSSNSPVTVTFPKAFANVFSVTATVDAGNNSGSGVNIPVKVLNISSINFQVAGTAVFSGDTSSQVRWMAIGN